jgi:hypothetical protein
MSGKVGICAEQSAMQAEKYDELVETRQDGTFAAALLIRNKVHM